MNSKTLLGLGAIGGAVYLATSKKAQSKVKKTTGLSDSTKDPAKIKKLREIVKEHQYKRISGKIVDVQTANMILQVYDNLPADKKKDYAKKSIPEMARTGWSILSKSKSGLSDGGGKTFKNSLKAYSHIKSIVDSNTKSHYEMGSGVYYTGGKIYLDKRIAKYRGITSGTESKYLLLNPNSKDVIKYLAKELKDDGVLIEEKISKSQMNDYRY